MAPLTRLRILGLVLLTTFVTAASAAGGAAGTPATAATPSGDARPVAAVPLPLRLPDLGDASQVVIVTADGWRTTRARLQAWQLGSDGTWQRVLGPFPARLGWNGFVPGTERIQSSGETPAGTYRMLSGFGRAAPPVNVKLPYRVVRPGMWWPYDPRNPRTYNVMQWHRASDAHWRTTWAEHLIDYRVQYRYAVVLDYNLPGAVTRTASGLRVTAQPADTRRGGGIFLHVNGKGPTAGCVSTSSRMMRLLLRWIDPQAHPVIAMGPRDWLLS